MSSVPEPEPVTGLLTGTNIGYHSMRHQTHTIDTTLGEQLNTPSNMSRENFLTFMNSEMTLDKYLKHLCCRSGAGGWEGIRSFSPQELDVAILNVNNKILELLLPNKDLLNSNKSLL